ncbi:hypothetical protein KAI68_04270 [bacterium]|nr:hypothetical protein [bacterium]
MGFDFPAELIIKGYQQVINFYVDFRVMQHVVLFIILAWWFTHPNTQGKRFLCGYLSLTFLGLTGAMAHTVNLIGVVDGEISLYLRVFEFLLFVLFLILLIDAVRGKSLLHLPGGTLRWIGLVPIMIIFWYIDRSKCPGGYLFKFFERIAFFLCIATMVESLKNKGNYQLTKQIWKWWVIIPLSIGIWYPVYSMKGLKTIIFSPYGLLPVPTLLVAVSLITLAKEINKLTCWMITLAGFYFGLVGWLKLKIGWDFVLVITCIYSFILLLSPKLGSFVNNNDKIK